MALAQRFNVNTQSKNGTNAGTNLSLNDIVPIQPVTKGTSADDEKLTVQQIQSIPYGYGNLSGTTYTVTLVNYPMDFTLRVGAKMLVKFNSAKSGSTQLNLSINGVTVPMQMQGVALTEILANQILEFTFVGTIANGVHTITSANASAGMSASQVNSALANLDTLKLNVIDIQNYTQTNNTKYVTYRYQTNVPTNAGSWIVESSRVGTTVLQTAKRLMNSTTPDIYSRIGTISGTTITWTDWVIVGISETSLNTTLTDYRKSYRVSKQGNSAGSVQYFKIENLLSNIGNYQSYLVQALTTTSFFDFIVHYRDGEYQVAKKNNNSTTNINVYKDGNDIYIKLGAWQITLVLITEHIKPTITQVSSLPSTATAIS